MPATSTGNNQGNPGDGVFASGPLREEAPGPIRFSCPGPALCVETVASLRKLDRLSQGRVLEHLLAKFLKEGSRGLRTISTHLADDREEGFRDEVHLLKGSCQVLGALRMDQLCQRLLDLGPGTESTRSTLVAELALAFEEFQRSLWILPAEAPE